MSISFLQTRCWTKIPCDNGPEKPSRPSGWGYRRSSRDWILQKSFPGALPILCKRRPRRPSTGPASMSSRRLWAWARRRRPSGRPIICCPGDRLMAFFSHSPPRPPAIACSCVLRILSGASVLRPYRPSSSTAIPGFRTSSRPWSVPPLPGSRLIPAGSIPPGVPCSLLSVSARWTRPCWPCWPSSISPCGALPWRARSWSSMRCIRMTCIPALWCATCAVSWSSWDARSSSCPPH